MARGFNGNVANYLIRSAAVVATVPMTMACWYKTSDTTNNQALMCQGDEADNNESIGMWLTKPGATQLLRGTDRYAGVNYDSDVVTNNDAVWKHAAGVFQSASRLTYFNGTAGTAETTVLSTDHGLDNTTIGVFKRNAVIIPMNGSICDAAIWNVALTAAEIMSLSKGISPYRIRPNALKGYWPMFGNGASGEADYGSGTYTMTETGAVTVTAHAPIATPFAGLGHNSWGAAVIPPVIASANQRGGMVVNVGRLMGR